MIVMIIAAVDLMVAVPLLTLGLVNSDVIARRLETPAALNVSCHICNIYTSIIINNLGTCDPFVASNLPLFTNYCTVIIWK